jgi:hypothetical protein
MHRDTLLVTKMNGELLDPIHGYPVRLVVPGWYGVASVKWVSRIAAIDHAFTGYYQSKKYTIQKRSGQGTVEKAVVGPMAVKSEMIRPHLGERLGLGTNRIFGVAWGGEEAVAKVEVSVDGGKSWADADLLGPQAPYSWAMWEYLWEAGEPGAYSIVSRAVSAGGRVQPDAHDPLLGGYQIHFVRPREVVVEHQRRSADHHANFDTMLYDMNAFAEENTRRPLDLELEVEAGAGI